MSMAEDELGFLQAHLRDDELAQAIFEANAEGGVALLLKTGNQFLAIVLWRLRNGAGLKDAVRAIVEIEGRIELCSPVEAQASSLLG